jgi:hypothetical protein
MIFIFGTRESHLRTIPTPGHACPACANNEALSLLFFSRYAHLFFVPLFPVSRRMQVVCANCRQSGSESAIPASLLPSAKHLQKQTGRPWWQFIGLMLVGAAVAFFAVAALTAKPKAEQDKEELARLRQPQVGDVYVLNTADKGNVLLLRVQKVVPDSVYVSPSKAAEGSFKAYQHSHDANNYQPNQYALPLSSLVNMHQQGELYDVLRD